MRGSSAPLKPSGGGKAIIKLGNDVVGMKLVASGSNYSQVSTKFLILCLYMYPSIFRLSSIAAASNFSNITATIICSKMSDFMRTKDIQKNAAPKPVSAIVSLISMFHPSPVSAYVIVIIVFQKVWKFACSLIPPYLPLIM